MTSSALFETVTKLDAAERQLRVAIRIFFERKDLVAIYTLAAASQDVLRHLAQLRGLKDISVYDTLEKFLPPEKKRQVIADIRKTQNFFKHAGKDPNETLNFYYEGTEHVIFDAVLLCFALIDRRPRNPESLVFFDWFMSRHFPDEFPKLRDEQDPVHRERLAMIQKYDDFSFVLETIDRFNKEYQRSIQGQ